MREGKRSQRLERRVGTSRLCLHCNQTKPAQEMCRLSDGQDLSDCCQACWGRFLEANPWYKPEPPPEHAPEALELHSTDSEDKAS
jgi:hypothetical protein